MFNNQNRARTGQPHAPEAAAPAAPATAAAVDEPVPTVRPCDPGGRTRGRGDRAGQKRFLTGTNPGELCIGRFRANSE